MEQQDKEEEGVHANPLIYVLAAKHVYHAPEQRATNHGYQSTGGDSMALEHSDFTPVALKHSL